jgi:hypothetical protein
MVIVFAKRQYKKRNTKTLITNLQSLERFGKFGVGGNAIKTDNTPDIKIIRRTE